MTSRRIRSEDPRILQGDDLQFKANTITKEITRLLTKGGRGGRVVYTIREETKNLELEITQETDKALDLVNKNSLSTRLMNHVCAGALNTQKWMLSSTSALVLAIK